MPYFTWWPKADIAGKPDAKANPDALEPDSPVNEADIKEVTDMPANCQEEDGVDSKGNKKIHCDYVTGDYNEWVADQQNTYKSLMGCDLTCVYLLGPCLASRISTNTAPGIPVTDHNPTESSFIQTVGASAAARIPSCRISGALDLMGCLPNPSLLQHLRSPCRRRHQHQSRLRQRRVHGTMYSTWVVEFKSSSTLEVGSTGLVDAYMVEGWLG
jgi:hypothetical protein